jgi:CheY-like chemotaxis protein
MKKLKRILLVDDDNTTNFLNQLIIGEMNITGDVIVKENGQEALKFIKEQCFVGDSLNQGACPDLILLDINMPVMNGFEFLEALKKLDQDIIIHSKVVMLSSSNNGQDMSNAQRLGVKGYLNKPLTEEKVNTLLEGFNV